MAFAKGYNPQRGKGGKRAGSGRKSNEKKAEEKAAAVIAQEIIAKNVTGIMGTYIGLAKSGDDPATTRHAIDKLIPPVQRLEHKGNIIFNTNVPDDDD